MNLTDHAGVRLTHGKPKVNGVEIHYAIGGAGEPVFLLHGVPKTMSYWRHVVPLLTPHYTVIAVDNRGFGGSQRPLTGYDTATRRLRRRQPQSGRMCLGIFSPRPHGAENRHISRQCADHMIVDSLARFEPRPAPHLQGVV